MIISVIILVVAEIVGLWFLENKLVIPQDRQFAAFWVFQFTVVSLSFTLLSIVYDSVIIARENMKIYSYVGIVEGLIKLGIAYIISIIHFDRLITYSFLLSLVSIGLVVFYASYCSSCYPEARFKISMNKSSIRNTFSFISWNVLGTAVWAINDQGINILLNLFFGPVVNAARGVAFQINQALNQFTSSFFTAIRPQIMKSYASKDSDYLYKLLYSSSKYSVYLLWYFALPVMICIDSILSLWLKSVPEYTNVFTIWILIFSLVNTSNNPIWALALAIGRLKWYIIIGSFVFLMTFPIAYIVLLIGFSPVSVFIVSAIVRAVYVFVALIIIKHYFELSLRDYMIAVFLPILQVVAISGTLSYLIKNIFPDNVYGILLIALTTTIIITCCIFFVGVNTSEKKTIKNLIRNNIISK